MLMKRRTFLLTAASAQRILGANDRINVGLIGCGGRGRYVAGFIRQAPNTSYIAVADVWRNNADAARVWAGGDAKSFSDFRKLLEMKDVDAVHVATPDHWHASAAIQACQAGKHVFVEKPISFSIHEGRAMVDAARRYKRTVYAGTQQRSAPHFAEIADIVQSGKLGKVHYVRVWNFINMFPKGIGSAPDSPTPDGLDWDMYCGPAPLVPYNKLRHLATYRWFSDYSHGYITDYGTHRFDTVHQIMGVERPTTVSASGGKFALTHIGDVPDTLQVTYEYPGFIMSYEASNIAGHGLGGRTPGMKYYNTKGDIDRPNGMAFYGTNGVLFADRVGYEIYPEADRMERITKQSADATNAHGQAFIAVLRGERKQFADIEQGHRATSIALMGSIAYKTGRKLRWDADKEEFIGDLDANQLLARVERKPWGLPKLK